MSPGFVESASTWFGIAAVGLTALAAVAGCLAWYFSSVLAERKDGEYKQFRETSQASIAEANEKAAVLNERAAQAELKLEELRKQQTPRAERLRRSEFQNLLQGKVTGEAMIWYFPDDVEAMDFAFALMGELTKAKWTVGTPEPIPSDMVVADLRNDRKPETLKKIPLQMRAGGTSQSINVISQKFEDPPFGTTTPVGVIRNALIESGFPIGGSVDDSFPPNKVVVVIGKKP